MSEPRPVTDDLAPPRRFHFARVIPILTRPRPALAALARTPGNTWVTPMLILTLTALLLVLVAGPLRRIQAESAGMELPPDSQFYFTPQQEAQFQQAQAARSSPTFIYLFPALAALGRVWIGWPVAGAVLHLTLTLLGARGTMRSTLNLVAWSGLPFALRDLVRGLYVLITDQLIASPGLSGFVVADGGALQLALVEVFKLIDLYLLWHMLLLVWGVRAEADPGARKAWAAVLITQLVALSLQALPGLIAGRLGGLTIMRPFLF